ncbi:MAG: phenyltransferase domain-containing protein [Desulfotignum sp.]|nr:phenyltransferase domain-containing protein [Desulfotignum sp.]MCF8138834.1 phenyltransferase domain-containing protein [Desulfotignum sp.]
MHQIPAKIQEFSVLSIASVAGLILKLQRPSGDIPWHRDGKTDPWDLVESVMGLNIAGYTRDARRAMAWLQQHQNPDGSWFSSYVNEIPEDKTCQAHMACYIAVGMFHAFLITRDRSWLDRFWGTMEKGVDYALGLQVPAGEIHWARSPEGKIDTMSLLAGSSSVFMSLKCALTICHILDRPRPAWEDAWIRLAHSLKENVHSYNVSKSRFSMYWFYPVLCGAIQGEKARVRVEKYWHKYMIDGQGARCVSDRPWVTIAETCELVLALHAMGNRQKAQIVFSWIQDRVYDDKTFWCGYTYPDMVIWPEEKISWTNAVALMAADSLYDLTPASGLFCHENWDGFMFTGKHR